MYNENSALDSDIDDLLNPKWREEPTLDFSYSYTISVDLGKMRDGTVITCIMSKTIKGKTHHVVVDIQKLKLGMNFVKQSEAINAYMQKPHFKTWGYKLLIDGSGLGLPVCDILASEYPDLKFQKIVITAGDKKHSRNGLIRNVIKWMSKPNFFISTDVLGSEELKEEIISLKMDHRQDGSTFFVTTSEHDDFGLHPRKWSTNYVSLGIEKGAETWRRDQNQRKSSESYVK